MLLEFGFSNSYSFAENQTFSLVRAKSYQSSVLESAKWMNSVSPVAAIFGANASGKTNVIRSFHQCVINVTAPLSLENRLLRIPNLLSGTQPQSSVTSYSVKFIASNEREYHFAYQVSDHVVISEQLSVVMDSGKQNLMYLRTTDVETLRNTFKYGKLFAGNKKFIEQLTKPGILFLSAAQMLADNPLIEVYKWFQNDVRIMDRNQLSQHLPAIKKRLLANQLSKTSLIAFLEMADLGIADLHLQEMPDEQKELALKDFALNGPLREELIPSLEIDTISVELSHKNGKGNTNIHWNLESDGTKYMFGFAPILMEVLDNGGTLFIDELESNLHPTLVRAIVEIFISPESNPNQSQLVFTTHDVSLLNTFSFQEKVFDGDQLWITEKDEFGHSNLFSIADFGKPRTSENIYRRYLSGQYGGLPNINLMG